MNGGSMSENSFTETSKISYGKNVMNSFSGVIVGLIIFLLSFFVLWKNEGHNVAQLAVANYADKTAIEISADKADRANDEKLVQLSGKSITDKTLTDKIISVPNTFVLNREVEMYQWQENVETSTKEEFGGSTTETKTYSYEKVWSPNEIESKDFKEKKYVNPPFPIQSGRYYAEGGVLGDFKLTSRQIKSMNDFVEYDDLPQKSNYKIYNNAYYSGQDPENPKIGDIRISYKTVLSGTEISIIGQQKSNNTIAGMRYKDKMVYMQQGGILTKDEMIHNFKSSNKFFTNLIRFAGWLMMFIGLSMLLNPLSVIVKFIPIVQNIVGGLATIVCLLVSLALSLLTISIAWFAYRPLLTITVLLVIGAAVFVLKDKFVQKK